MTGVWVDDEKICAFGVRMEKWATMHGFALNLNPNMKYFEGMIPCGIFEYGVTSMNEQGVDIHMQTAADIIAKYFHHIFIKNINEV